MMSVIALSAPRDPDPAQGAPLAAHRTFVGVVAGGILLVGFVFNWCLSQQEAWPMVGRQVLACATR